MRPLLEIGRAMRLIRDLKDCDCECLTRVVTNLPDGARCDGAESFSVPAPTGEDPRRMEPWRRWGGRRKVIKGREKAGTVAYWCNF